MVLWDIHEMSYIILGLMNDYRYFGERSSLEAARKTADYILRRWSSKPSDWPPLVLHLCVLGVDHSMLSLHRETKDPRYLDFCLHQRGLVTWDQDIVIGRDDKVEGHVYAYLAECLAQLDLYRLQPDEKLLRPTRGAIQFIMAQDGMAISGGVGHGECWTNDQNGSGKLGETCATAYQFRVYDSLLRLGGNPRYGDMMERTIFNALFGAELPDGRRLRYYTPLEGKREFFNLDTYCCPCNYRRIVSELPTMIYYRERAGLAVNLYTKSEVVLDVDRGVSLKVRQETDYPNSGHVVIHLDPVKSARFPAYLRIPRWCRNATVAVNGKRLTAPVDAGTFLRIERTWNAGDQVTLDVPMTFRLVLGRKKQAGRVAVMRGPLVFCLNPDQNKTLKDQDAATLASIRIDPASLQGVSGDTAVRPCGTACQVRVERNETTRGVSGDLLLKLTEFADPRGRNVYFSLAQSGCGRTRRTGRPL